MKIYFFRHAIAQERELWSGSDFSRPLTDEGKAKLQKISTSLSKLLSIDLIVSSNYKRAKETAGVLSQDFNTPLLEENSISLGADYKDFYRLFNTHRNLNSIMFVGHEPDFSYAIAQIIGDSSADITVKKASLVEIEVDENFSGTLLNLLTPKMIINLTELNQ